MELTEARELATRLIREHGLTGWRFAFDNARTRAGVCRADRREIGLSRVITPLQEEAEVRDTVLHEIAHALVGPQHGHDGVWRAKARSIGCTGMRCMPEGAVQVPAAWVGRCAAGHEFRRHRRPGSVMTCVPCARAGRREAVIDWLFHGREVPMGRRYEAQLALLRLRREDPGLVAAVEQAAVEDEQHRRASVAQGDWVRLGGSGRYAGQHGRVLKRARTRFHVELADRTVVTAPFALVTPLAGRAPEQVR
ncbi:MAG TPA: SprT-like domain-containing protein [Segeticoccus sp.]|nr:SprT-like domain-containing protein [Segeticoccus sp.]